MVLTDRQAADMRAADVVGTAHQKVARAAAARSGEQPMALRTALMAAVRELSDRLVQIYADIDGASDPSRRDEIVGAIQHQVGAFLESSAASHARGGNAPAVARLVMRLQPHVEDVGRNFDLALHERMKSKTEGEQRGAVLQLIPIVSELLEGLELYIRRLGDDGGVKARIIRTSHFGLFEPPVERLHQAWRLQEPKIHDAEVRRLLHDLRLRQHLETLKRLSNADSHDWDTTVLAMRDLAQRLDGSLRRAAGSPARGSSEPTYRVAGFTLDEPIGQGAYGEVWRAREQSPLETIRAVKLLRPSPFLQDESIATRFVREARALIGLNHRAIVRYVSTGWTEGGERTLYLVMEMISGSPLRACASTLEPRAKVTAIAEILEGLEHAHSTGVFHRDVKPSNIMVRDDGQPVLVDFGLVCFADFESDLTNATLGSPGYVPPEVSADPRSSRGPNHDVYAAGITLYEILVGAKPNIQDYRPLTEQSDELEGLDRIVQKALARVADRFQTAGDFASALRAWLSGSQPSLRAIHFTRVKTTPFREQLIEAERAVSGGDAGLALVIVAAVFDAMRICWSRAARRAGGVDLHGKERHLPARVSQPAMAIFGDVQGYWQEPKLAEDRFGPASLLAMGFTPSELTRLRKLVDRAEGLLRDEEGQVEIDHAAVIAGLDSVGLRLLQLEGDDPTVFEPTDNTA